MTFAPLSAACTMPFATAMEPPLPLLSSTRTGRIDVPGARLAKPLPLPATAPTMPATCVPWPTRSAQAPSPSLVKSAPRSQRTCPGAKSSCVARTPVSTTATRCEARSVLAGRLSAFSASRLHW